MPPTAIELPTHVVWARHGLWARFTPDIEPYFARYYAGELLQRARWAAAAAALMMVAYAVMDILMIPPALLSAFLWIRCLFVIAPLTLVWAVSFFPIAQRVLQPMAGFMAVSSGLAIVTLICLARRNGTPIEYEGIILTLFYFYCCGGIRMRWAVLAGVITCVVYPTAEYFSGLGTHEIVVRTIFLVSTNAVGMVSAALIEHAARHNFAQTVALQAVAHNDFLTGLLNRRAMAERLQMVWRHAAREQQPLYVAMLDVDFFKRYNDHYGHAEGDEVLRAVADILKAQAQRPLDLAARYGGEEFVCVWMGSSPDAVQNLVKQVLHGVHALDIAHEKSPMSRLSLSMGVVQVWPAATTIDTNVSALASKSAPHTNDIQSALRQADALLYQAKEQGRNRAILAIKNKPITDGVVQELTIYP